MAADIAKLTAFQFALYRAAHMPLLLPVIETLWLQTGSCLRLLYPDYIRALKHDWRGQIIRALQAGAGDAARRAIESAPGPARAYTPDPAGADGITHTPTPPPGPPQPHPA